MSVSIEQKKAFEKLFKSLVKDILGFDYTVEFNFEWEKTQYGNVYVGQAFFNLTGTCIWPVYSHYLIENYIEYIMSSLGKYVGIERGVVFEPILKTINGVKSKIAGGSSVEDKDFKESDEFKQVREDIAKKYSKVIHIDGYGHDVKLLNNKITPVNWADMSDMNYGFDIDVQNIFIDGEEFDFNCVDNPDRLKQEFGSTLNREVFETAFDLPPTIDLGNYIESTGMFSDNRKFWNWTDYAMEGKTWIDHIDGVKIDYDSNRQFTFKNLLNFMVSARDMYNKTKEQTSF
jgi:hypothetical protein